jgi:dCMP deaminase
MIERIDRQTQYMKIAEITALRGTCNRKQVGCVLVDAKANRIVSVGYNGSHKGSIHCCDSSCLIVDKHCVRTIHAEVNAVLNLEHKYDNLICYTTSQPCINCFKLLIGAHVSEIFYLDSYFDEARDLLNKELLIRMHKCLYSQGKLVF